MEPPTLLGRRWALPEAPPAAWIAAAEPALPIPLRALLWARGFRTPAAVATLLHPAVPPAAGLPDMDRAVQRLLAARARREVVLIAGDYDADGVCATALAAEGLAALGLRVAVHLPHRQDGFGLQADVVAARLRAEGATVVLAVDNGSTAHAAIAAIAAAGADVLIADHHQLDPELPPALAVLNPQRDPASPFVPLTGVGVTWYLVQALGAALGQEPPASLDLVAVGTVADVGPLVGVNRALVQGGLALLAQTARPGLAALQELLRVPPGRPPTPRDISHGIAPRLNAPGRLGDPMPALDLLLARDPSSAAAALDQVEAANTERREAAFAVLTAAEQAAAGHESGPLVLADPQWPAGLVGPAAAALSDRMGVPVLLANRDASGLCRGSGRAPEGWDLGAALRRCAHLLIRGGGHARAAGFEVRAADLEALRAALAESGPQEVGGRTWLLDGVLDPGEVRLELALAAEDMGPFGAGNPEPHFLLRSVWLEDLRRMGQDGRHLRGGLRLPGARGTRAAVGFGLGDWLEGLIAGGPWDVVVRPEVNRFRGQASLELCLADAAPTSGDWRPFLEAARAGLARRHPDRDTLATAYRRLTTLARQGPLPPDAVLLAHLTPASLPGEEAARAALRILRELSLLDDTGLPPRAHGGKVALTGSARFRLGESARQALARLEQATGLPGAS